MFHQKNQSNFIGHGVKVGPEPGTRGLGTRDPSQSLKVEPGALLRFKSGTPGSPPQSLKMGPRDPFQSLKVGPT